MLGPKYDEFAICLNNLKKKMQKNVSDVLKPYNLSSMHSMYLATLLRDGEMTLAELSRKLSFNRANTTRVVKDLIQKGYVGCDRTQTNLRKFNIYLTEKGKTLTEELIARMEEMRITQNARLSKEEWKVLLELLNKLAN